MRQFVFASLAGVILLLAPFSALADAFQTFYVDPSRSFLTFESGSINTQVSSTIFPSSSLIAQAGGGQTALAGEFVMQVGGDLMNPTSFGMLPGLSDIRPADTNPVSPGTGGAAGTTNAAFGFSFLDAGTGLGGDIAVHDLIFGTQGGFSVGANPVGPVGLSGALGWTLAAGTAELATSIGIGGTAFLPVVSSFNQFLFADQTQYSEVSAGVYELLLPFSFSMLLGPIDSGPFTNTNVGIQFTGTIVASSVIPEPATGGLVALGLVVIGLRRRVGGTR